jgi:hypothetical protein
MAKTGKLVAWVGQERQEDGHITRGAIAPN